MNRCPLGNSLVFAAVSLSILCTPAAYADGPKASAASGPERHLKNIRQLTFGRQNAEAYFSFDGTKLIFQSTNNWMKDSFAATLNLICS